jgi:hypothetical protein
MTPTPALIQLLVCYDVEATKQLRRLVLLSIELCETGLPTLLPLATYNKNRTYSKALSGKEYTNYVDILHGHGIIDVNEETWMPCIKPKFFIDDAC